MFGHGLTIIINPLSSKRRLKAQVLQSLLAECGDSEYLSAGPAFLSGVYITHPIIVRPRSHFPSERRCAIVVQDEIGSGGYGAVYPLIEMTFDLFGNLQGFQEKRVVKALDLKDAEYEFNHTPSHLGMKKLVRDYGNKSHLVMRKMPGVTLASIIRDLREGKKPLTPEQLIRLAIRILQALEDQVHQHGLVHMDITPANILVDKVDGDDPVVNIIDFGICIEQNNNGIGLGTKGYASPEQSRKNHTDERSDIFSAGVSIMALFGFSIPAESYKDFASERKELPVPEEFPYLRQLDQDAKKTLKDLFVKMTQYQLSDRCTSKDALNDLYKTLISLQKKEHKLDDKTETAMICASSVAATVRKKKRNIKSLAELKGLLNVDEVKNIDSTPMVFRQFIERLGIKALTDCDNHQQAIAKIDSIIDERQQVEKALEKSLKKAEACAHFLCEKSSLFKNKKLVRAANQQAALLKRKLAKCRNEDIDEDPAKPKPAWKRDTNIDLDKTALRVAKYKSLSNNPMLNPYKITIHYHAAATTHLINSASHLTQASNQVLSMVTTLQQREQENADNLQEVDVFRQELKGALSKYLHKICKPYDLSVLGRKNYANRINEVNELLSIVESAENNAVFQAVTKKYNAIEKGFFGQSRLKNLIGKVILNHHAELGPQSKPEFLKIFKIR